jgi:hypothetical protein
MVLNKEWFIEKISAFLSHDESNKMTRIDNSLIFDPNVLQGVPRKQFRLKRAIINQNAQITYLKRRDSSKRITESIFTPVGYVR